MYMNMRNSLKTMFKNGLRCLARLNASCWYIMYSTYLKTLHQTIKAV